MPKCPKGKVKTTIPVCREPDGRTQCPSGSYPVLTCRKEGSKRKVASYKVQEVKRLQEAIKSLDSKVDVFVKDVKKDAEDKIIKTLDGDTDIPVSAINNLKTLILDMPSFTQYAFEQMIDRDKITSFSDPIRRYKHIVEKNGVGKLFGYFPTVVAGVFHTTLRHYMRNAKTKEYVPLSH